jgi:[ribosomal protein S5]-alanine N-acetyltransferase
VRLSPPQPPLEDGVVRVRGLRADDAPAYAAAFVDDPDLGYLAGVPEEPDEQQAVHRITVDLAGFAEQGRAIELAVASCEDDRFLGSVILWHVDWDHWRTEAGIWLAPGPRRQGVGRRAMTLLIDWAFGTLGFERVVLDTLEDNAPMRALASALGFTHEGVLREHVVERGARRSLAVYGMLAREWRR